LAASARVELIRFDMSEYMGGTRCRADRRRRRGYVGSTRAACSPTVSTSIRHACFCSDEIERRIRPVNVLLQDDGPRQAHRPQRKQVDFRTSILIMTPMPAPADMAETGLWLHPLKREVRPRSDQRMFTRNSATGWSHPSPSASVARGDRQVSRSSCSSSKPTRRPHVTIELSEEASRWLIANATTKLMGARPMARVIQEHIRSAGRRVLFGHLNPAAMCASSSTRTKKAATKLGFEYLDGRSREAGKAAGGCGPRPGGAPRRNERRRKKGLGAEGTVGQV